MPFDLATARPVGASDAPMAPSGGFDLSTARPVEQPVTALNRAGAFAAGVNRGVAATAGLPIDTLANVRDLGKAAAGRVYNLFVDDKGEVIPTHGVKMFDVDDSGQLVPSRVDNDRSLPSWLQVGDRAQDVGGGEYIAHKMDQASQALGGSQVTQAPRPDDTASRYLFATGLGASSAALAPGRPLPAVASGVAGSNAAQLAAEQGSGPGAQALAGFAGGVVPSGVRVLAAGGTKGLLRGGEEGRQRVEENALAFKDTGTTPSVGQATESRVARATESFLSRSPGSAGRIAAKADTQGAEIGTMVEKIATSLSPKSSGEQAGRAIQRGVTGEGGFVQQFKTKQEALFNELDKHIAKDARVDVAGTRTALAKLNEDIPGAENVSELFKNSRIKGIQRALDEDLSARPDGLDDFSQAIIEMVRKVDPKKATELSNGFKDGKLPYEAVKKLRTLVGREMADSTITSDVPRSKWTALYGALSEDLRGAANAAGDKATAAFNRANKYTFFGMKRIEVLDAVVDKAGGPEAVFRAATAGAKEGATTLRAVMQSLPKDAQKTMSASVLRRLGRATSGKQDDLGERFSTETFLTNWNAMSPQAKAVLFDRYGKGFRQDMDQIAKVTNNLREGSAVFRNSSGTGAANAQTGAVVAAGTAIATGHPVVAALVGVGVGSANIASRAFTNPKVVSWLAKSTRASQSALPALINQAAQSDDPDLREIAALVKRRR